MITECNRLDDGEVAPYFFHFVLQQEVRLVVKIAGLLEYVLLDGFVNVARAFELLHIFGNAARHAVEFDQFLTALSFVELVIIGEGNLSQADLACPAPIQGAIVRKRLGNHHGNQRAAKDEHDVAALQDGVPNSLHDGREGGADLAKVLKLVDHDDDSIVCFLLDDIAERIFPFLKWGAFQKRKIEHR